MMRHNWLPAKLNAIMLNKYFDFVFTQEIPLLFSEQKGKEKKEQNSS